MSLYSYLGQEPAELPYRIRLDAGLTRTSLNELSLEELTSLGFVPVSKPSYDSETQKIVWNIDTKEYQVESLSELEIEIKKKNSLSEKISQINFNLFWNRFFGSSSYKKLKDYVENSIKKNNLLKKVHEEFNKALTGNANYVNINECINLLFYALNLTDNEKEEIKNYITESGLDCIVTIPSADDILSNGFDPETNKILGPSPFPSWTIVSGEWKAPVEYPIDGKIYKWSEELFNWVEI